MTLSIQYLTLVAFIFGPVAYLAYGKWKIFALFAVFYLVTLYGQIYFGVSDRIFSPVYFVLNLIVAIQIRQLAAKEEKELEQLRKKNEEKHEERIQRIKQLAKSTKK